MQLSNLIVTPVVLYIRASCEDLPSCRDIFCISHDYYVIILRFQSSKEPSRNGPFRSSGRTPCLMTGFPATRPGLLEDFYVELKWTRLVKGAIRNKREPMKSLHDVFNVTGSNNEGLHLLVEGNFICQ